MDIFVERVKVGLLGDVTVGDVIVGDVTSGDVTVGDVTGGGVIVRGSELSVSIAIET